ncbi:DUF1146 family protein [Heyndrickxia ginsengihumi]|uniref:DUF1146 domain-containing protein n=1 Tax=Heyndrickxia ginsengihumi TaxID=363870 RepID=A0A0A6Y341_9BACI|nr:DUF1146 family protein [Heyndrickxia ginsengihumi]KHD86687.1 membrane protein [Heyndrickxia ginsengihumi]MBE6184667.1 DUF1146 domain-containing protein [Bacillus sp. (in: firmicutes)]MCM3022150.1 DUF1146 family protein [Heyndrickxia ginsengihumi]NEY18381.1 DUF1146 domain-containing protein [Heyndrickxia ginsengihumi]
MLSGFGNQALISILTHLFFIAISFWALQAVNIEQIIKKNRVVQARLLYVLLSLAIGSAVSNFFLNYLLWSQQLPQLFQFIFYH